MQEDLVRFSLHGVRTPAPGVMEADVCEVWTARLVNALTGTIMREVPATLGPQTLVIQQIGQQSFITEQREQTPPGFCAQ
jgi:hypothetical protein